MEKSQVKKFCFFLRTVEKFPNSLMNSSIWAMKSGNISNKSSEKIILYKIGTTIRDKVENATGKIAYMTQLKQFQTQKLFVKWIVFFYVRYK